MCETTAGRHACIMGHTSWNACAGGDAFITICLWRAGFAHSDPGWSFSRPDMRMFDPVGDGPNLHSLLTNASEGKVGAASKVRHPWCHSKAYASCSC